MSKVAIVGLGYVGLPLAVLAKLKEHEVLGLDLDKLKLKLIKAGKSPITDDYVESNLRADFFEVDTDFERIKDFDNIIICVPTPVKNDYMPDYGPLEGATISVAKNISKGTLIIIESTINPGVSDEIVIPLIERHSGLKEGKDFYVAHCPERINPGDPKWNVQNIPRVLGCNQKQGLDRAHKLYESIIDGHIRKMGSIKEAEAVKVVENAFRDVNIAFVNELAMSFSKLGINVMNVINGAATKPFSFLAHYPGVGVGGHCIPVDPYYLIEYAKKQGFEHNFLLLARSINNQMPHFTIDVLSDALNEAGLALSKAKIAILGISYKANVGDDRESPYYKVVKRLREKQAQFDSFDPYIPGRSTKPSLIKTLENKDAVLLVTNHKEFSEINFSKLPKLKVVVDGRNCLDQSKLANSEIIYRGIGS